MNFQSNNLPPRAGKNHRNNPDRFFHVMSEGWFVYTREGLQGPFIDRSLAAGFLQNFIEDIGTDQDPSDSWRL